MKYVIGGFLERTVLPHKIFIVKMKCFYLVNMSKFLRSELKIT